MLAQLTPHELFRVRMTLNAYEFILGFVFGQVVNELMRRVMPFSRKDSWLGMAAVIAMVGVPSMTGLLYIRDRVETLPGLREFDLPNRPNFAHPPPLALGFGFWGAMGQLKARNQGMEDYFAGVMKGI